MADRKGRGQSRLTRWVLLWLAAWLVAAGALWLLAGRPKQVAGDYARRGVGSGIAFLQAQFDVKLTLVPGRLPHCPSPNIRPTDILLVLDHSSSMGGAPLQELKRAVGVLLDHLDMSLHRVGVVQFASTADLLSPITDNAAQVRADVGRLAATGGTDIAAALAVARGSLPADPDRRQIVVLFSDGGSAFAPAAAEAAILHQAGVQVICVGFVTPDYDPRLLEAIASSPDDVVSVTDPTQFSAAFQGVASLVSQPIGQDLQVRESLNLEAFAPPVAIANRLAASGGNVLPWQLSLIPATGAGFTYPLTPIRMGLHELAPDGLSLSLIGCDGLPIVSMLGPGPQILVLPPWPLLLLLFLLPLLAALIYWLVTRSADPRPRFDPGPPYSALPLGGAPDADLQRVEVEDYAGIRGDPARCRAALFVGVGQPGLQVLAMIKANLLSRFGEMPKTVRLLHVDFSAPGRVSATRLANIPAAYDLAPEERLILEVDREETGRFHTERIGYSPYEYARPGRWRGRALLSYDFATLGQTGARSRLRTRLMSQLDGLKAADCYVLLPAGGEEGGMAFDLPSFLRRYGDHRLGHQTLILLGARAYGDRSPRGSEWQAATLRELARLGAPKPIWSSLYGFEGDFVAPGQVIVSSQLQKAVYVKIDRPAEGRELIDQPMLQGALARLADWLSAIAMCADERVDEERGRLESARIATYSDIRRPMAGAVGCAYLRFPVHEAHEAFEAQFMRRFLSSEGLLSQERPDAQIDAAHMLLRPEGPAHALLSIALDEQEARRFVSAHLFEPGVLDELVQGAGHVFDDALTLGLRAVAADRQLGGGALGRCQQLLENIEARLQATSRVMAAARRQRVESKPQRRAQPYEQLPNEEIAPLGAWYSQALQQVASARGAIDDWAATDGRAAASAWSERSGREAEAARARWEWQTSTAGARLLFSLSRHHLTYDDLAPKREALEASLPRWLWHWDWDAAAQKPVLFLAHYGLGYDLRDPDERRRPHTALFAPSEHALVWQRAAIQAHVAASEVYAWSLGRIEHLWREANTGARGAAGPDRDEIARALAEESALLSDLTEGEVARILGLHARPSEGGERRDPVAGDPGAASGLKRFLLASSPLRNPPEGLPRLGEQIAERPSLETLDWDDPFGLALLTLADQLPLEALDSWREYVGQVEPEQLLWPPEKEMRGVEQQLEALARFAATQAPPVRPRGQPPFQTCWGTPWPVADQAAYEPVLHPEFGNLLNDPGRAALFARAILYGLIRRERDRWVLHLGDVAEALYTDRDELNLNKEQDTYDLVVAMRRFIEAPLGFEGRALLGAAHADTLARLERVLAQRRDELGGGLSGALLQTLEAAALWECRLGQVPGRATVARSLHNWLVIVALRELGFGARE